MSLVDGLPVALLDPVYQLHQALVADPGVVYKDEEG